MLVNLERQRSGSVQHLNGGHLNLNLASRQVRVLVTIRALGNLTGHAQNVLVAQVLEVSLVVENALGDALAVTQVNEGDATVVAATSHPTGQGDGLSNVCGGQLAVGVSAKHRHSFHSGHLTTIDSSRVLAVDDMRTLRAPHILYPLRAGRWRVGASQAPENGVRRRDAGRAAGSWVSAVDRLVSSPWVFNPG